jgi:hypothetical protein
VTLLALLAWAGAPKYQECSVVSGAVSSCRGPYSGEVVRGEDGGDEAYLQACVASNGSVTSCSGPFTGTAVLSQPGAVYRSCSVKDGKVFWCDSVGFTGTAVIRT